MTEYKVVISEKALTELEAIKDFISVTSAQNANTVLIHIFDAIQKLATFPFGHPIFRNPIFRKIVIDNHIILFSIDESTKTVTVQDVFYGKRNK